jgi:RNA polymerase sigma factor (sigma-70 family)
VEVSALKPTALPGAKGPAPLLRLQSDERLIALTRRGQQAAFEALVSRYHSRLLAFCRHMLSSKEDAEDVLQEVFAAAFNAILADERAINVRPWLYRIARNRSLNQLRRASAIGVDDMDIHYANHGMSTGEQVLRRESFRQLIGDVQQLPETQRTALLLREIDALSYEQIAQAMETTVPSVKSLLVRARISLAEAAEARQLSCADVREQLGEASEGLLKIEAPARRHLRDCERCRAFRKHLKDNNHALAAIFPVGPLLLLKKLVLTKFGSTASAGGAHAVGAGGATAGASAAASAGVGAGAAGGMGIGGFATAGAGALATKAATTLAAAALVTAGAVEVDHASRRSHRHRTSALTASTYGAGSLAAAEETHHLYAVPTIARSTPQPASALARAAGSAAGATRHRRHHPLSHTVAKIAVPVPATPNATTPAPGTVAGTLKPTTAAKPPVTQVTTESTPLPTGATSTSTATSTTTQPAETPPPTNTSTVATTPPPPPTTTTEATSSTPTATTSAPPPPATVPNGGEQPKTTTTTTTTSSSSTTTSTTGGTQAPSNP